MQLKSKIKVDRSGKVSPILLAVIVIAVVAIAAVALYFVMSDNNDDGDDDYQMPDEKYMGAGSIVEYNVTESALLKSLKMEFVGQNNETYFVKTTSELIVGGGTQTVTMYIPQPKVSGSESKITGTQVMDTIDGEKTLFVVEVTDEGETHTAYIDQLTGLPYKMIYSYGVTTLTSYKLVEQTEPYEQSDAIDTAYEYTSRTGEVSNTAKAVCIADCADGKYGILLGLSSAEGPLVLYYTSAEPLGVPTEAMDSGMTNDLSTIDGLKSVEFWIHVDPTSMISLTFCYDPVSKTVYEIDAAFSSGTERFALSDKNPTDEPDTGVS